MTPSALSMVISQKYTANAGASRLASSLSNPFWNWPISRPIPSIIAGRACPDFFGDIYAHFINYNIQTALFTAKEREIKKVNKQRQHDYKPNRNVTAGLLKRFLVKFMLRPAKERKHWMEDFNRQILQTMEPIRPEKNKERQRRSKRGAERHAHESNYRHAL